MQNDRCLESVPDQLLLPRLLDRLTDYTAQFQKLGNLIACLMPSMFAATEIPADEPTRPGPNVATIPRR